MNNAHTLAPHARMKQYVLHVSIIITELVLHSVHVYLGILIMDKFVKNVLIIVPYVKIVLVIVMYVQIKLE